MLFAAEDMSPGMASLLSSLDGFVVPDCAAAPWATAAPGAGPLSPSASSDGGGVVPDLSLDTSFDAIDLTTLVSELDALQKPKQAAETAASVPPPPAAALAAAAARGPRGPRPRGVGPRPRGARPAAAPNGGGADALATYFPKRVLRLGPDEYQRVKSERFHLLTPDQQRKLTALRRRARNCVYAEEKRQARIAAKRSADSSNQLLTDENLRLREENARLRLELAAFAAGGERC